ncbi:MAG: DUF285 domain-containing protein, partial [Clostridiales bacterium]|nr:DUF285 domain-containing protein [Clostridiales bacterium]
MSNHDESTNYLAYPTLMPLPVRETEVVPGNASGHDVSVNYLVYPTLMPLPVQQDTEADLESDQIQRLLAEKQRLAAELAHIEAELQNMETPSIPQRPDNRQTSVHAEGGPQLLAVLQRQHTETVGKLLYVLGYALKQKQQQCGKEASAAKSKKQNVLGNVGNSKSISLDGVTAKADITEIRFLNTLAGAPKGAADLSEAQDGGVLCWTENGVQYIAGEGGVTGGKSCANLFAGYEKLTAIWFDGNFDTSHVTDMSGMFF